MRIFLVLGSSLAISTLLLAEQTPAAPTLQDHLRRLFPLTSIISPKEGNPPFFKILERNSSGGQTLSGVAFLTTDVEPLERGYDGPVKILVGMGISGKLLGIVVIDHHEPYGYFSVDRPEFAAQFVGKDIRDPFKVGQDIDAVSRASITVNSATRAIRNGARRIARATLTPPSR